MRVAVLDDYQRVAHSLAPWDSLGADVDVEFFADHLDDEAALARRLEPFDAVVLMREHTRTAIAARPPAASPAARHHGYAQCLDRPRRRSPNTGWP